MARELRAPQRPQNDRPQGGSAGDESGEKPQVSAAQTACRDLSNKNMRLDSLLQAITRSF